VQLDLTWDPAHGSLKALIELDNEVLDRFTHEDRQRIGAHVRGVSPDLLPELFSLQVGRFLVPLATEPAPRRVLELVKAHTRPDQRVFVGVIDPASETVEPPSLVRDRVLLAAEYVEPTRLGTCDDGGFDADGSRDVAFAKIQSRVEGTHLAADVLGA
jgi:5-methyltetrahydropteroyltriglutamate--homocysteine methyltransferase